jgi:hypothetical protein
VQPIREKIAGQSERGSLNGTCFFLFNPLIYERYRRARGGERGEGPFIKIII